MRCAGDDGVLAMYRAVTSGVDCHRSAQPLNLRICMNMIAYMSKAVRMHECRQAILWLALFSEARQPLHLKYCDETMSYANGRPDTLLYSSRAFVSLDASSISARLVLSDLRTNLESS
jgi:hypothetical protein